VDERKRSHSRPPLLHVTQKLLRASERIRRTGRSSRRS